jgi:thiamine kinase-like enzyme
MTDELKRVQQELEQIPGFESLSADNYSVTRLGGLTNLVFRIDAGNDRYVLRIPGNGTEAYIDRKVEMHNARVAARAGVSAEVVHSDGESGILLLHHIDDSVTMTPQEFAQRPGSPARAGEVLKRLHNCGEAFEFRFELFAMIDDYLKILDERNAELPPGYAEVVESAAPVRAALQQHPTPLAPCHCDPLCENFLDDGERMWIVDWEYSGMNDPLWDLGDLSVEAGFTPAQDMEMMRAYCGREPLAAEMGRMVIYQAMCDLLWTLWGLIQHSDGNPAEDFWAYAIGRFERCQALMRTVEFDQHIAAVAMGSGVQVD